MIPYLFVGIPIGRVLREIEDVKPSLAFDAMPSSLWKRGKLDRRTRRTGRRELPRSP